VGHPYIDIDDFFAAAKQESSTHANVRDLLVIIGSFLDFEGRAPIPIYIARRPPDLYSLQSSISPVSLYLTIQHDISQQKKTETSATNMTILLQ
jgi:hypothetical protein